MYDVIKKIFLEVFCREVEGGSSPNVIDSMILLESGMDSLGFAILVMELEEQLGFDPFSSSEEAYYPQTFGELVEFYIKNKP